MNSTYSCTVGLGLVLGILCVFACFFYLNPVCFVVFFSFFGVFLGFKRYRYWVLSDIRQYCVVLLLGDIFIGLDTQYDTFRSISSQRHPQDNHLDSDSQKTMTTRVGRSKVQARVVATRDRWQITM